MIRHLLPATALALLAACGSDPATGDDADAPADELPAVEADAGTDVDAAAAPVLDAGTADAAADAGRVLAAQCEPGSKAGSETTAACWTLDELGARGCVAASRATSSVQASTTAVLPGGEGAAAGARWALHYTSPGVTTLYLCSSAPPATDWRCAAQPLADCSVDHGTGASSCMPRLTVPALRTMHAICASPAS